MIIALRISFVVLALFCLWLILSAIAKEPRVRVTVESGVYAFEPAFVRLRVTVVPDAANRALTIALISDGFETSSLEELPGEQAPRTRWVQYRDVPAGSYTVSAVVHRPDDRSWRAGATLTILPRFQA